MGVKRVGHTGGAGSKGTLLRALTMVIVASALLGMCAAAFADTVFSDNFEAALAGWTLTGSPDWFTGTPKNGTHDVQLKGTEAIERVVSTAGYSNITVSFALAANSLDNVNEIVRASWYDGTAWTTLKQIRGGDAENDKVLRTYSYVLPAAANDNASLRLRFEIIASNHANDFGWVDDVLVTGQVAQRTLTLTGVGSGSVKVNGTLQSLPWSGQFANGASVTLEAVPGSGWAFANWSGNLSGSANPTSITMNGAKSVTASFSQLSYTLSVAKTGSGSVKVNGTTVSLPYSAQFLSGTSVTLEAVPTSGWAFANWSGDLSGSANPTSITMNGARSVTASFSQLSYTLSVTKTGGGSVKVNGTVRSLPWSGVFYSGDEVTLEAVPDAGWRFAGWSGDATWPTSPLVLTMTGNKSIVATFEQLSYTLSIAKVGSGSVLVNGAPHTLPWSGQVAYGTEVTLEAVAATGWRFDGWSGDATWSGSTLIVTVTSDKNLTANFSQLQYTLSVAKVGSGSVKVNGTTVSLPYSAQFLSGTAVTLEAVAQSGWELGSWSGDASGSSSPITVTMDGGKSVTATFTQLSYTLSVSKVGSGSVKVNGTTVSLPYSGQFLSGTAVTLEAVALSGWEFDSWSGDASGSSNPVTVTMGGPKSVTATFSRIQYTLNLSKVGSGSVRVNGTVRSLPWSGVFYSGDQVTLEAVPDEGWRPAGWSGDATWPTSPLVLTMTSNKTIVATFEQLRYTLSIVKAGSGSVLVNGAPHALPWSGQVVYGTEVRLEAVAADGWRFDGWSGDSSWSGALLIVTMTADKSLTANFSNASCTLSITGAGSGSVRVNGTVRSLPWSGQFIRGTEVTLAAQPADGWQFAGWSGDSTWSGALLIVSMTADKNLIATFTDASYALSLSKVGSGSVRVNGVLRELPWSGRVLRGSQVTLEAAPASGWQFSRWSGDASWSGETLTVTMSSDKSITATFTERTSFVLSLSKNGSGTAKVNGNAVSLPWSGEFDRGGQVTIEAVADSGWQFDGWSGDLSGSDSPAVVTMDRDWTVSATFSQVHYQLSVDGVGGGSIKVDGVAQTLPWSGSFVSGSQVSLEAVAERGWRFAGWSGGLTSADNPATVELDDNMSISATFVQPNEFMLTVTKVGTGTVKVNGTEQSLPWSGTFARGSEVILEAVAEGAESFVEWSGDSTGSDNPLTVTMDYDMIVTANFVCVQPPFSDVPCDYWAAEAITAAKNAGVIEGYPDGLYRPGWAVDRGAMAVYIARAIAGGQDQIPQPDAGEPTFPDVPASHWAYAAVEYVASGGIVHGYGDGSYQPDWDVTRGQMAVFIALAVAGEQGLDGYEPPADPTFADVPTSMWCYKQVEYLVSQSMVAGYPDGMYRPTATVTRDQMAVYMAGAFELTN